MFIVLTDEQKQNKLDLRLELRAYDSMYVEVSICSGSSLMSTSNRSCTLLSTSESAAEDTKVIARPCFEEAIHSHSTSG